MFRLPTVLGIAATLLLMMGDAQAQHRGGRLLGPANFGNLGYGHGLGEYGFGFNAPGYGYNVGGYGYIPYRVSAPPYARPYVPPATMSRNRYPAATRSNPAPFEPAPFEPAPAPPAAVASGPAPATVTVLIPDGAKIWFNGEETERAGGSQVFTSPEIEPGKSVELSIRLESAGRKSSMTLQLQAGTRMTVDLRN